MVVPTSDRSDSALRAAASVLIERMQFMRQAGITFGGKRDLYDVLGYDRIITNKQYRDRYARGGITKRIVEALPKATWRGGPEIVEDEDPTTKTAFELAFAALATRLKIWSVLLRADILAGLSNYSVILIGGPSSYDQELPKGHGDPKEILFLTPFTGGGGPGMQQGQTSGANYVDATIQSFETDTSSSRFGLPTAYLLRRLDVSSPELQKPVHWSRVLHIAEGCLDNEVYGIPTLENVWNLLDDLDKVTGGGAEAFWLRANQGLHMMVDKDAALSVEEKAALTTQAEEYQHQLRRIIQTRKVDVASLGSETANFSGPADTVLTQIAGSKGIPKRILTGSEMGELASSQDRDNWKDQINGRQTGYAEQYMIRPLVDRLIAYNYLPVPTTAYQVRWGHIETLTEQEKADGAAKWATTNKTQGTDVFTNDEIRDKWYGMEPLTPEQIQAAADAKPKPPPPAFAPFGLPGQEVDENGDPIVPKKKVLPFPKAAEGAQDVFQMLERAIEQNDTDTIDRLIGIRHAENPEGINQYTSGGVAVGYHVVEHLPGGKIAHHGVFKTKAEGHKVGMKLRREGHATTYVHHSSDIVKHGIRIAEGVEPTTAGGSGSGNFGHGGRPGEVGGSGEGGSTEKAEEHILTQLGTKGWATTQEKQFARSIVDAHGAKDVMTWPPKHIEDMYDSWRREGDSSTRNNFKEKTD
jgi:uncharacterized protein